ncbi:conserved hypothetical protein, partial [Ricinus communis]
GGAAPPAPPHGTGDERGNDALSASRRDAPDRPRGACRRFRARTDCGARRRASVRPGGRRVERRMADQGLERQPAAGGVVLDALQDQGAAMTVAGGADLVE